MNVYAFDADKINSQDKSEFNFIASSGCYHSTLLPVQSTRIH